MKAYGRDCDPKVEFNIFVNVKLSCEERIGMALSPRRSAFLAEHGITLVLDAL